MTMQTANTGQQPGQKADAPGPKSGIVWLASYPKSGNTWTRAFLHNLAKILAGERDNQDINALSRFSTWEPARHFFASALGFEPTDAHRQEIAAVRKQVQQRIADAFEGLVFVKTHNALIRDRGHPTINFSVTAGAIYIVRNPLDVAISYADHIGEPIDVAIDAMGTANAETNVGDRSVHEVYGSWSQHVLSWTRNPHPAIRVMRYEDMLSNPNETFGALARHLHLDPGPSDLAEAIDRSSFEKLRAQEDREGFLERSDSSERFFRERVFDTFLWSRADRKIPNTYSVAGYFRI